MHRARSRKAKKKQKKERERYPHLFLIRFYSLQARPKILKHQRTEFFFLFSFLEKCYYFELLQKQLLFLSIHSSFSLFCFILSHPLPLRSVLYCSMLCYAVLCCTVLYRIGLNGTKCKLISPFSPFFPFFPLRSVHLGKKIRLNKVGWDRIG